MRILVFAAFNPTRKILSLAAGSLALEQALGEFQAEMVAALAFI